jgi:uncharacterized protein YbjT (DUF2867 family)/lipoate-protein ligase A
MNANLQIASYDLPDAGLTKPTAEAMRCCTFVPEQTIVVIGKGSDPVLELREENILSDNVPVLRRGTGGCAVVLTPDMLAVSFAVEHSPQLKSSEYFRLFNAVIIRVLEKQGVRGLQHAGTSDIALHDRKIAGTAIYRNRELVFYHAILNIAGRADVMERYLKHPPRTPAYRVGRSHAEFVTSLREAGCALSLDRLQREIRQEFLSTSASHFSTRKDSSCSRLETKDLSNFQSSGVNMYVVTGATGNTGKIVAEELLAKGKKVRVVGRDANRLQPLVARGADAFVGSLDDEESVVRAFAGAEAVYAMIPPNMKALQFRIYQNRVADAMISAIRQQRVQYVVTLSSVGADVSDKTGPVAGLYDFEQKLNALNGVNVLILRAGYFMENLLSTIKLIKTMNMDGGALKADVPLPLIAARDIGAYAARRLLALDFSGISVQELQGPRDVTMNESVKILGAAIGKPDLCYVEFGYDDAIFGMTQMGLPREIAGSFVELMRAINDGLVKFHQPRSAQNSTSTTLEEFAPMYATAYQKS